MRRLEYEALTRALSSPNPAVITAAAGVVLQETARQRLRDAVVAWLRARPETLTVRVAGGSPRPLLAGDPLAVLREMEQQRRHLYESVAEVVVDVDELSPADAALRIAHAIPGSLERDGSN